MILVLCGEVTVAACCGGFYSARTMLLLSLGDALVEFLLCQLLKVVLLAQPVQRVGQLRLAVLTDFRGGAMAAGLPLFLNRLFGFSFGTVGNAKYHRAQIVVIGQRQRE